MSIITRTSTFAMHNNLLRNINQSQARLFEAQDQLSSGLKSRNFAGFSGQVEQFVSLESKIKTVVTFQENNAVNVSRLETTKEALKQITDVVDQMEDLITLRRNPALANDIAFEQQMHALMRSVAAEMNTTFEGKYLFSGTKTNVPPIMDDPTVTKPVEVGVPDDGYYRGSKEDVIMRVDENVDLRARVRGDHIGFQRVFAAAHQALEGHENNKDDTLSASLDLLQVGLKDIIAAEASVNADILAINNISERQNSLQLYWQGVTEEVANTDVLAVSTKLAVDETILTASFQAFASISQLRLSNFL